MSRLERSVRSVVDAWAVPSGAVVVTSRGGVIDEYYFGTVSPAAGPAVDAGTLFEIGSISKVVTGLVVLRLAEHGLLRLEQSVAELLPWLPAGLRSPWITLERLLQHNAGILSGVEAVPDPIAQLAAVAPAPANPDAGFHYSNLGFLMLGAAASAVAGESLPELATRLVLGPAGMDGAVAAITDADRPRLAVGTQTTRPDRPWWPGDALEPAPWLELDGADGNVAASGRQLAALGRLLLNRGKGVIAPSSFDQLVGRTGPGGEPLLQVQGLPRSHHSRYGLGVNTELHDGRTLLSHGGGMVGYASFLLVDPDSDRAVAVVTSANGDSPVAEAIARAVLGGAEPDLHPEHWATDRPGRARAISPGMTGRFGPLQVSAESHGDHVRLTAELDGVRSALRWGWGDRIRAELPDTERYGLTFTGEGWACGGVVYGEDPHPSVELERYCGHYRSYTPWFPHFRIVQRSGRLLMCVPGGVESPGEETELVPVGRSVFGLGASDAQERVEFQGIVGGLAQWADRDGCRYSRSFTD